MRKTTRYILLLALMALLFGVVSAQALPATLGWNITTVDSDGFVGSYSSLALDTLGHPHISYYDYSNTALKYARWNGSGWSIETVDSVGIVGWYTSLALDTSGYPYIYPCISYYDASNGDLKYAWKKGSGWSNETVDSDGDVGSYSSLALDGSGYPHISYYDITETPALKYAVWTGSEWSNETVDALGVGEWTSLALDEQDYHPHISYRDVSNGALKYAAWTGSAWSIETLDNDGDVGYYTSLALDGSGNPHISYFYNSNQALKYAAWNGSAWSNETVDSGGVGYFTSLALDASGYPHISYYNSSNGSLKYAAWTGSAWSIETVDSDGNVGWYTSLALDASGDPHISYYDDSNYTLKYAVQVPVPFSAFSAAPTSGTAPLTVTFTDESTGSPTQWLWLFGDGGTSTAQHPDHTFTAPGTYSVTLTATNPFGSDTAVMENYITVLAPPTPPPKRDGGGGQSTTAVAVVEEGLNAGENATFNFDESAIYRIVVTAETNIPDIMITASKATLPASIPTPNGTVFEYAELTLYKVTDDAIAGTLIEFTVPLSWLDENGFDPSQVMLLRWHDGEWQELPTEIVKEENGKVYFRAESFGLSLFAIIGVETLALDDGEVPTGAPTAEPTSTPAIPEETESPATTSTTPQETPLLWAPLLALGAFLFFRKRK
jgi:PGF-pre-PGF domain-containing protein